MTGGGMRGPPGDGARGPGEALVEGGGGGIGARGETVAGPGGGGMRGPPPLSVAVVVAASAYLEVVAAYGTLEVVEERVAVVAVEPL